MRKELPYEVKRVDGIFTRLWKFVAPKKYNYEQEQARRRSQIERGILTKSNGLSKTPQGYERER